MKQPAGTSETAFESLEQSREVVPGTRREPNPQAEVLLIVKRGLILIASLFALFCASLEVERVGIALSKQQ